MFFRKVVWIMIFLLAFLPSAFAEETAAPMLASDGAHILALDVSGRVWAWGSNHRGETAPEDESMQILAPVHVFSGAQKIAAGQQFSMAVDAKGDLYMWGDNTEGQIPGFSGERTDKAVLVAGGIASIDACDSRAVAVTAGGELVSWGGGEEKKTLASGVTCAAAGTDFILALMENGDVYEYASGSDEGVCMASGISSIDANGQSRYAVDNAGNAYSWGANAEEGRIGLPLSYDWAETPIKMNLSGIKKAVGGLTAGGAIAEDKGMYLWGTVYSYMTGYDAAEDIWASLVDGELIHYGNAPIRVYEGVLDAVFGDAFVAVMFENGDVLTWGSNEHGQIGNGLITETRVVYGEEEGETELEIVSSMQQIFPYRPINLED